MEYRTGNAMTGILIVIAVVAFVSAFIFEGIDAWQVSRRNFDLWVNEQFSEFGDRSTLIWVIKAVEAQFVVTGISFAILTEADPTLEYVSFAAPCLGGLVVGHGILADKRAEARPLQEPEILYYFLSLACIAVGYVSFLLHAHQPNVLRGAGWTVAFSCLLPLLVRRAFDAPISRATTIALAVAIADLLFLIALGLFPALGALL